MKPMNDCPIQEDSGMPCTAAVVPFTLQGISAGICSRCGEIVAQSDRRATKKLAKTTTLISLRRASQRHDDT